MKIVTNNYKNNLIKLGREQDSIITYTDNGEDIELGNEELNSITPHYQADILKSVMKQLDIDSNVEIPVGTELNYQYGLKVGNSYEYIDYGNYIVAKVEKKEDTDSYQITCYDKMLYTMVDYETPEISGIEITYPITIRDYINAICSHLGLTFESASDTFANYNRVINSELYLTEDGGSLGYTFRDVLDELAEVTASVICINNDDKLEIRYPQNTAGSGVIIDTYYSANSSYTVSVDENVFLENATQIGTYQFHQTQVSSGDDYVIGIYIKYPDNTTSSETFGINAYNDYNEYLLENWGIIAENSSFDVYVKTKTGLNSQITLDEEWLKDVNVKFGKLYGPINTVVLTRSAGSDSIYYPSTLPENPVEIKIEDNQIMNGNDRSDYLLAIYDKLNGLTYSICDYSSPGITFLELYDKYNISVGDNTYPCLMLNDETLITQGLTENVYAEEPEKSETEYKYASSTDKAIDQAYIIVKKNEGKIEEVVSSVDSANSKLNSVITAQTDTERTIDIISTYIDKENGEIHEVTTTNGFTFNSDGLNIHTDENSFNTQITNERMQHKDGDEVITETSKDGFLTTYLRQKNQHFYGWDGSEYNFVDEEITVEGEECYATFWNGSDT